MTSFSAVQDVLENYQLSVYEHDVERFLSAYSPDLHIYDCWGNWECLGKAQWKNSVTGWFAGLKDEGLRLKTTFDDVIVAEDSNLAFVHCTVTFTEYNAAGEKQRHMSNRFTFCLSKEGDSWAIVHEHSSLPIHMETGKGMFDAR